MNKYRKIAEPAPIGPLKKLPRRQNKQNYPLFLPDRVHIWDCPLIIFSYAEVSKPKRYTSRAIRSLSANLFKELPKALNMGCCSVLITRNISQTWQPMAFRPNAGVQFGIQQTYDGSTQAQAITNRRGDTTGFSVPSGKNFIKTNYFISSGTDIGYCPHHAIYAFLRYSGIKILNSGIAICFRTPHSTATIHQCRKEYYWFSFPLGLALSKPISTQPCAGIDACLDLSSMDKCKRFYRSWDSENHLRNKVTRQSP